MLPDVTHCPPIGINSKVLFSINANPLLIPIGYTYFHKCFPPASVRVSMWSSVSALRAELVGVWVQNLVGWCTLHGRACQAVSLNHVIFRASNGSFSMLVIPLRLGHLLPRRTISRWHDCSAVLPLVGLWVFCHIYCRVPARRGLHLILFLLRQGEPGTSQYILYQQAWLLARALYYSK